MTPEMAVTIGKAMAQHFKGRKLVVGNRVIC
jgi:hypothetical protein